MAIDPLRADRIEFTAAYVQIEGSYLVPQDSPIRANEQVDQAGTVIVVGAGSAYALYLARAIRNATLLQVPTSEAVVPVMLEGSHPVAAGVRQQLEADALRLAGVRVLAGRFMVIDQAMAMPRDRSPEAHAQVQTSLSSIKLIRLKMPRWNSVARRVFRTSSTAWYCTAARDRAGGPGSD